MIFLKVSRILGDFAEALGKSPTMLDFSTQPRSTLIMTNSLPTYRLVTVNKVPERAKRLIGQMSEALKDRYIIIHSANCETIDQVSSTVQEIEPQLLVSIDANTTSGENSTSFLITTTVTP